MHGEKAGKAGQYPVDGKGCPDAGSEKNIQQDVDDGAGIWRNYDEIKKHLETEMGALASDVRADHHSGILRNNSGRDSASDAALGFPKRPWLILLGCTFYGSVCRSAVTGLVVQDTATYWSEFGQAVILLLIQIGGMGVRTVAVAIACVSGRKIGLMQRSTMQESIAAPQGGRHCADDHLYY